MPDESTLPDHLPDQVEELFAILCTVIAKWDVMAMVLVPVMEEINPHIAGSLRSMAAEDQAALLNLGKISARVREAVERTNEAARIAGMLTERVFGEKPPAKPH